MDETFVGNRRMELFPNEGMDRNLAYPECHQGLALVHLT